MKSINSETSAERPVPDKTLVECCEYITTLVECGTVKTIAGALENTAYVYLHRKDRLVLAWRIFRSLFP